MAISIKSNQVLDFAGVSLPCNCGGNYCQPVENDDTINIQGTAGYNTNQNKSILASWDLTAGAGLNSGWRTVNNMLYGVEIPNSTDLAVSNKLYLKPDMYYEVYMEAIAYEYDNAYGYSSATFSDASNSLTLPGNVAADYTVGDKILVLSGPLNNRVYTISAINYPVSSNTQLVLTGNLVADETITFPRVFRNPVTLDSDLLGYNIKINGEYLKLADSALGGHNSKPYIFRWFYKSSSITDDYIKISSSTDFLLVAVNNLHVKEVSRVGIALFTDSSLVHNTATPDNYVSYYPTDTYKLNYSGTETLAFTPVLWNMALQFSSYEISVTNCIQVALYDYTMMLNAVLNGEFTSNLDKWTAGSYWSQNLGKAVYNPPGSGSYTAGTLTQTVYAMGNAVYSLSVDVDALGGAGGVVSYSINGGPVVSLGTITHGANSKTISLVGYSGTPQVQLIFGEAAQNEGFYIDNVQLIASIPDQSNKSNCIDVKESHSCTLYLTGANDDAGFGFDYNNGFVHALRVKAKIDVTGYPEETEKYTKSNNEHILLRSRSDKEFTVYVTDAPVHVHDLLRIVRLHDTFKIGTRPGDLQEYVQNSAYTLDRRKSSALKQSTFTVIEKQGLAANYPCS